MCDIRWPRTTTRWRFENFDVGVISSLTDTMYADLTRCTAYLAARMHWGTILGKSTPRRGGKSMSSGHLLILPSKYFVSYRLLGCVKK
jgi:hypothetical protein